ncbi:MAG TPA: hypothetical protein VGQ39_18790 [Pyrinomonadaceae bacterium]|nr:hypothetical protein [Pyrinomonadaceae bacterium]
MKGPLLSFKPLLLIAALLFTGAFVSSIQASTFSAMLNSKAEDFGVKEYDEFHRVLHHLQHEALPKNDLATIRTRAKELIKLGDEVLKLGVPEGTKAENVESFKKELATFRKALAKYGADAESGTDADLKTSYTAVHDSFEELAGLLPRK